MSSMISKLPNSKRSNSPAVLLKSSAGKITLRLTDVASAPGVPIPVPELEGPMEVVVGVAKSIVRWASVSVLRSPSTTNVGPFALEAFSAVVLSPANSISPTWNNTTSLPSPP